MFIKRIYDNLDTFIEAGKVLVIYGARQVGKTTLLNHYLRSTKLRYKLDSGDNIRTRQIIGSLDFKQILEYIEGYELYIIDEAQQIPNVGKGLKIIVDQRPDIMVIATGSSSFDLARNIGEPLTGRKRTLTLYSIAQLELIEMFNQFELKDRLDEFLIFGAYPEVITADNKDKKMRLLTELVEFYLLKDILSLERVKGSGILLNLLKLLAFQVGGEVAHNELATQLRIDVKTVGRYLDLLEKSFVIYRLGGFSRNSRKEITKKNKYYFLDNGIRNAVIAQFNPLNLRNDIGQLWENFLVTERLKKRAYRNIYGNAYFWRTYQRAEIDIVEERAGKLFGTEIKWAPKKRVKPPKDWISAYPQAEFKVIDKDNYQDFII